jgi:tRNA dimethylallyltransferase
MQSRAPVVFLMGPTAAGKTDVAVSLVRRLPVEIVSVDSAMVYRGLDIGTGKPDAATLALAPHRLIDIRDPEQPYSAAEFRADALRVVAQIRAAGRVPLLVGGTGLYFRALRHGLTPLPGADPPTRARLQAEALERGWAAMHARLAVLDPAVAARIRPSDPQRIQRALEVIELTGIPMSELERRHGARPCPFPVLAVSLEPASRGWLHRRIETRFRSMLEAGLEAEVRALLARSAVHGALPAMRAVGYRQVCQWMRAEVDRDAMIARALAATRQLARRQLTWLRREPVDARVAADDPGCLDRVLRAVVPALRR